MEDFFASVADRWPPGRDDYHWHVLPGTELARERLARPYADLTSQPGLAPVRPEYMHVTVQHIGPVREIAADELREITGRVRGACSSVASFAVTAGRAEVWETSVVCPIRPGYLLGTLWHLVTSASTAVTGSRLDTTPAVYHPHLTLAYATAHADHAPLRAWLADSDAAEAALPVTRLVLVAQQHDRREITFRIIDEIPLTGGAAAMTAPSAAGNEQALVMTEVTEQHTLTADCPLSCLEDQLPARAFGALKRYFQGRRLPHPKVGDVADLYQQGSLDEVSGLGACGIQRIAERLGSRGAASMARRTAAEQI